ncbi:MAG: CGGC domain-containing protein [Thermodesulfobacteriota bacterium]|nr:CGGC domain-containing protein [Thermodesulfobacteriota bacterium]
MKIAILVREETALRCTGKGCLDAFFAKKEGFEIYQGKDVELCGFFNSSGDLDYKLNTMKEAGVQVIHVSTCMRGKYSGYAELVRKISESFDVIGYSHGPAQGKSTETVSITGKYL